MAPNGHGDIPRQSPLCAARRTSAELRAAPVVRSNLAGAKVSWSIAPPHGRPVAAPAIATRTGRLRATSNIFR